MEELLLRGAISRHAIIIWLAQAVFQTRVARSLIRGTNIVEEIRAPKALDLRRTLHESNLALIENCAVSNAKAPSGHELHYQVVLPYNGLFAYNVGKRRWLIDANRTFYISPGWDFFEEHPLAEVGHSALLVSLSREFADELCGAPGPSKHIAFVHASLPCSSRLQILTHAMLRRANDDYDPLYGDEWIVSALRQSPQRGLIHARTSKLIDRVKQMLHAHSCERMSLNVIAREVGATPVYLTQEFSRSEGMPLYQYQLRLRLNRALLELPHCSDITGLALDLGFSSHSHLTSVFRKVFGVTPSHYRSMQRSIPFAKTLGAACGETSQTWPSFAANAEVAAWGKADRPARWSAV